MIKVMLLPSKTFENSLLVTLPDDVDSHAAFRCAVSVIAEAETEGQEDTKQEIILALEDHGFQVIEYLLGPEIV